MKTYILSVLKRPLTLLTLAAGCLLPGAASAQLTAYDDAGNYLVNANWTNGANQGFGFTPWVIATNGPDFHGTYIGTANNPTFVIATITNVSSVNYTNVWGLFANGTNDINDAVAFRGFANPLGTNTFKLQWGSRGAGVTTTVNAGAVHGWCGFTLRNGNTANNTTDFQTGVLLYFYFLDGSIPPTLYFWDNNGQQSIPNTSFSDLGRGNITNALEVEVTPSLDGLSYHLAVKDCVQNRSIFATNGVFINNLSMTVDSVALFCHETTGDQIYNRMQIAPPTNIPPSIVNVQPADGSLYLDANATSLSFEVDSFNSTVSSAAVSVYLNGVLQTGLSFNTTDPTNQLLVSGSPALAPDTFYNYTITAQDANDNVVSNNYTFNTFLASDLYIDAYDYNYELGQFVNSPTPHNAYAGFLGTNGVDYQISDLTGVNNTAGYRPGDLPQILQLNPDATGDPIDHANLRFNGYVAYNIGFTDTGNWENFTRVFAATNYNIYARAASAGTGQFEIEQLVSSTATTSNLPFAALGRANVSNTGGSKVYSGQLQALTDVFGNKVVVPLAGTRTLRTTAISSRGYNLEYLLCVAVTNATSTLRPYIAVGTPAANATGVGLAGQISFAIANRQTTVTPSTIKLFLNSSNATAGLVLSNNAAGSTGTYSLPANLPANSTNTIMVTFTDSDSVNLTNTWSFITAGSGGVAGSGLWSGGGGFDLNWSTAANWTGGTPGPGFNASFASAGATTTFATNNIVSTNVTIQGLFYNTNNSGYHTTLIQDGVTLTITNGNTGITAAMQVGGGTGNDNVFNKPVTNTITGPGGTLMVLGNAPGTGLNQLNFQVRQSANPPAPEQTVLDMSGLGTLVATVGKFYVAQGGANTSQGQTNVSARVNLARTNVITCLRANAGQFEVGDSSGGTFTLAGSTLNLGITNALFVDTARFGKQKATNNLVRFNPLFTSGIVPAVYIRGTNGLTSRVSNWTIGDADTETTVPNFVQANMDLSGGRVDALISTMLIGRGETAAGDTGYAQGTLTLTAGTLDVSNLTNGWQRANNTAIESGIISVKGTATLVSPNITLAQALAGATASLVSGDLNVTNGTVRGNIVAGGGVSTVNLNGGALVVSNSAGTATAPLTALNLVNASLHLKADGNAAAAPINAVAVSASGTTAVTIDSVANVTGTTLIHLLAYTGTDPFSNLALAPLPAGYTGNLVDNAGSVDLSVKPLPPPVPPTIASIAVSGTQVILKGTNNLGPGGTYRLVSSTNVTVPRTNWVLLATGSFDNNGNFAITNSAATNHQQFYLLLLP
jgi:hypothetical protein